MTDKSVTPDPDQQRAEALVRSQRIDCDGSCSHHSFALCEICQRYADQVAAALRQARTEGRQETTP